MKKYFIQLILLLSVTISCQNKMEEKFEKDGLDCIVLSCDVRDPFGYGRIEYLTGMVVGILILYAGISMLKESIDGILHPSDMKVSMLMVLIVAGTAVTKFCLGMYTIKIGKSVESEE